MSAETLEWLNTNVLVGNVGEHGKPWHYRTEYQGQLTNCYDGFIPVADVIERLFDWEAISAQLCYEGTLSMDTEGNLHQQYVQLPGQQVIVNSKTGASYGLFKAGYRIHQYREWLIENVASLLDVAQGDLGIGSAGLLRNGGRAWVQVEPASGRSVGGTILTRFLTATTSHDGTSASTYLTGDHIAVCDNTLAGALLGAATKIRFKHTKNSLDKMATARETLDIVFAHVDETDREIERLMNTPVTDDQFWSIVKDVFPAKDNMASAAVTRMNNVHGEFAKLWHFDTRVSPWKGTQWGALMAFNTYGQWESQLRGVERPEKNMLAFLDGKTAESDNNILNKLKGLVTV